MPKETKSAITYPSATGEKIEAAMLKTGQLVAKAAGCKPEHARIEIDFQEENLLFDQSAEITRTH